MPAFSSPNSPINPTSSRRRRITPVLPQCISSLSTPPPLPHPTLTSQHASSSPLLLQSIPSISLHPWYSNNCGGGAGDAAELLLSVDSGRPGSRHGSPTNRFAAVPAALTPRAAADGVHSCAQPGVRPSVRRCDGCSDDWRRLVPADRQQRETAAAASTAERGRWGGNEESEMSY